MNFDWKIDAGQIILLLTFVVTIMTIHRANIERLKGIETKLEIIYHWFLNSIIDRKKRHTSEDE